MSQNFFAALDDSGDEAPAPAKSVVKKREPKIVNNPGPSAQVGSKRSSNDRNTKSGRGERNAPRDGKRAYDRRSGTGRGKEIKKGGGGARNWGSDKADAKKMEGTINEDEVKEDKPTELRQDEAVEDAPVEEKPVDNTVSYADYMASKGKKEATTLREVEDDFKELKAWTIEEKDFLVMGGAKQKKNKKKKDAQKKTVDVGFRVAKPNVDSDRGDRGDRDRGGRGDRDRGGRGDRDRGGRGDRDRGGRGDRDRGGRGGRGGRGRGGRGEGRGGRGEGRGGRDARGRGRGGGRGQSSGINVQDETAFPSL